ncbi:DUF5684 domain-containing protein [Microbacterium sp. G2-8]|uniref:DUF5684 domain-containing protein n=1 Tax=Microbacterium sp. G2-8 TaxID=2842454 RepID=UPI0021AA9FE0|nr:DUF5684 domain-containing protein [Microbacterium sp. G2-8]
MSALNLTTSVGPVAGYGDMGGTGFFSDIAASMGVGGGILGLILYVLVAIGLWKTFDKAGVPGVLGIIPILNMIFLLKVARMNMWLALLYLVPIANIVLMIIVAIKVGANFGKGGGFSFFLLWLLAPIGYLILGFGGDRYVPQR